MSWLTKKKNKFYAYKPPYKVVIVGKKQKKGCELAHWVIQVYQHRTAPHRTAPNSFPVKGAHAHTRPYHKTRAFTNTHHHRWCAIPEPQTRTPNTCPTFISAATTQQPVFSSTRARSKPIFPVFTHAPFPSLFPKLLAQNISQPKSRKNHKFICLFVWIVAMQKLVSPYSLFYF